MALTQAHLDALDLAIATGTLSVSFEGRTHMYQSTRQLIEARTHVATILNGKLQNRGPSVFRFRFTTSRGD